MVLPNTAAQLGGTRPERRGKQLKDRERKFYNENT